MLHDYMSSKKKTFGYNVQYAHVHVHTVAYCIHECTCTCMHMYIWDIIHVQLVVSEPPVTKKHPHLGRGCLQQKTNPHRGVGNIISLSSRPSLLTCMENYEGRVCPPLTTLHILRTSTHTNSIKCEFA